MQQKVNSDNGALADAHIRQTNPETWTLKPCASLHLVPCALVSLLSLTMATWCWSGGKSQGWSSAINLEKGEGIALALMISQSCASGGLMPCGQGCGTCCVTALSPRT